MSVFMTVGQALWGTRRRSLPAPAPSPPQASCSPLRTMKEINSQIQMSEEVSAMQKIKRCHSGGRACILEGLLEAVMFQLEAEEEAAARQRTGERGRREQAGRGRGREEPHGVCCFFLPPPQSG